MLKIEETIPKKNQNLLKLIGQTKHPLGQTKKDELDALEHIDGTCHYTLRDITSGKYMIKVPRFDPGTPEE